VTGRDLGTGDVPVRAGELTADVWVQTDSPHAEIVPFSGQTDAPLSQSAIRSNVPSVTDPTPPASSTDVPLSDVDYGAADVTPAEVRKQSETKSFLRELPLLILIALAIAVIIKTFIVQAFWIPSGSMESTLMIDDRVLVNKLSYDFGDFARGDIIVFDDPRGVLDQESVVESLVRNLAESVGLSTPKSEFIKRVVALPGETVEVRNGAVHIDGVPLNEPYVHPRSEMPNFGPELIPPGYLFVMGDNRNSSQDSRVFGPIAEESVVGRAFTILWPADRWSGL